MWTINLAYDALTVNDRLQISWFQTIVDIQFIYTHMQYDVFCCEQKGYITVCTDNRQKHEPFLNTLKNFFHSQPLV